MVFNSEYKGVGKKFPGEGSNQGRLAEKFPRGEGPTEKARPKNSTMKLLSTLSVPCIKIQGIKFQGV